MSSIYVKHCSSSCDVISEATDIFVGGLVGYVATQIEDGVVSFENCVATGDVMAPACSFVGGFAGGVGNDLLICPFTDCSAEGDVAGGNCVGGFIGLNGWACFLAETPISLADGTEKRIEDVKVGDMVINGEGEPGKVCAVFVHVVSDYLIINDIKVTANHPLLTGKGWRPAGAVVEGDYLIGLKSSIRVEKLCHVHAEGTKVFNIEVAPGHTYVACGVIVHNK